jgi:Fe-S-cluster containining protein
LVTYESTPETGHIQESGDVLSPVEKLPEHILEVVAGYQSKITRYFFEIACLGGLQELSARHALPSMLLWYMDRVMELFDEYIQFLLGHLRRRGLKVQCGPECPHCCYNMPANISIVEQIYLYYGMRKSDAADRYFRRCLEVEELWGGIVRRGADGSSAPDDGRSYREKALRLYQALERQCPFLQHDLCQVYPYRPFACRTHFSLSPPHWCSPSHFHYPYARAFNLEPWESLTMALDRLDKRFELDLSDMMTRGLLDLTVNVMEFADIRWLN